MKQRFENYLTGSSKEDSDVIRRNSSEESLAEIDKIQLTKKEFVSKLKQWRGKFFNQQTDNDLESSLGTRTLQKTENGFRTHLKGGHAIELSEGEVYAAMEWGTFWKFDDTVPKDDQQSVMAQQVRNLIAEKYDEQLISFGQENKLSDDMKRDTYVRIAERSPELRNLGDGVLAESLISSVLEKAQRDYKLPFRFKRVDVYEDVENKIDFIISLSDYNRGVNVSGRESQVGVQFTLDSSQEIKKQKQIDASKWRGESDVDDIVLVSMPFAKIRELFNKWRYDDAGKVRNEKTLDPRGPNMHMTAGMEKEILHALFSKLPIEMSTQELDSLINNERHQTKDNLSAAA